MKYSDMYPEVAFDEISEVEKDLDELDLDADERLLIESCIRDNNDDEDDGA